MPINKQEFQNGKLHSKLEEEIVSFLDERTDKAFTSQEIMEGLRYHAEFGTPEISKMSTFAIADFTTLLHHLVEKGKIKMKIVRGRMYIMAAGDGAAKCPKCGTEITAPKKTWNMAGRPNKKGESLQMQIGLFQCPKHGAFRAVLSRQRLPAKVSMVGRVKKKKIARKTASTRKRHGKRKTGRKKERRKKSDVWLLV